MLQPVQQASAYPKLRDKLICRYVFSLDEKIITSINSTEYAVYAKEKYSASNSLIDSISIGSKTNIIKVNDAADSTDIIIEPMSVSELEDGAIYEAYAYGEALADGSYPLVMIKNINLSSSSNIKPAAVDRYIGNGVGIYKINAVYKPNNDDSVTLHEFYINNNALADNQYINDTTYFKKGDIVAFQENKYGNIDKIFTLANSDTFGFSESYTTMIYNAFSKFPISSAILPSGWLTNISKSGYTSVAYGPVIDKSSSCFRMAIPTKINFDGTDYIATDFTNKNTYLDIKTDSNTVVYTWDFTQKNWLSKSEGIIQSSYIPSAYMLNNKKFIPFAQSDGTPISETTSCLNFAFVRTANGYAKEVFIFLAP